MSIPDFRPVLAWIKRNQADIAIFFGFILIALIGFLAGRLSAPEIVRNPVLIEEPQLNLNDGILNSNVSQPLTSGAGETAIAGQQQGMFMASKSSDKYHWPWCTYAQKIKEANRIWFASEAEAKSSDYSPCGCISKQAPAGYQNN